MSVFWMLLSAAWIDIVLSGISNLHRQGRAVGWPRYGQLIFWIGMFAYYLWNGIQSGRQNRQERIEREQAQQNEFSEKGLEPRE